MATNISQNCWNCEEMKIAIAETIKFQQAPHDVSVTECSTVDELINALTISTKSVADNLVFMHGLTMHAIATCKGYQEELDDRGVRVRELAEVHEAVCEHQATRINTAEELTRQLQEHQKQIAADAHARVTKVMKQKQSAEKQVKRLTFTAKEMSMTNEELTAHVKALYAENDELRKENAEMRKEIADLRKENARILKENARILKENAELKVQTKRMDDMCREHVHESTVLLMSQISIALAARIEEHAGGDPSKALFLDKYVEDERPLVKSFFAEHTNLCAAAELLRGVRLQRSAIAHPRRMPIKWRFDLYVETLQEETGNKDCAKLVQKAVDCLTILNISLGREATDMSCPQSLHG